MNLLRAQVPPGNTLLTELTTLLTGHLQDYKPLRTCQWAAADLQVLA